MSRFIPKRGDPTWIGPTYFLLAAAPGFWIPVLTNVLDARGWSPYVTLAFIIPPLAGMISPLALAARADQVIPAEKLLAALVGGGTIFLWLAFETVERGQAPYLFLAFLSVNALITAPTWSLLNTVTLSNLTHPEHFGRYRVWGTFGWMAAGWTVSALAMDVSPAVGDLAAGTRLLAAVCCLMLPHTPPRGGRARNLGEALGFGAFRILRQRDMAVYFGTSFFFSIPLAAFYLHTPRHLRALGWEQVAAGMTVGQLTEAVAMVLMGWFLRSWRIKWLLTLALLCGIARYALYAMGGAGSSAVFVLVGVAFHGVCWCYFFEAGRVFLQKRVSTDVRAQSQALLSLLTSGIGTLTGVLLVGWIQGRIVDETTGLGWDAYWWILTAMCVACLVGFCAGYRGEPVE